MKFVWYLLHNSTGAFCVWIKTLSNDFSISSWAHIRQNPTPVSERLFHRQVIEQRLCVPFAPSFIVLDCQPSLPSQMQWHYLWYSTRLLPAGVSECLTLPYFRPRTMFRNAGFAAHINQGYNKSETHTLSKFRQYVLIIDFGCHWGQDFSIYAWHPPLELFLLFTTMSGLDSRFPPLKVESRLSWWCSRIHKLRQVNSINIPPNLWLLLVIK